MAEPIDRNEPSPPESESEGQFPKTRWTLVSAAQAVDTPKALDALSEFCQIYWYPLYCYARGRGYSSHDAEDVTQSFFGHFISHESLKSANRERGKLRSFLLGSMKYFLIDAHRRETSQKRGGNARHISIDQEEAERRYMADLQDRLSPELEFDRAWARQLLNEVLAKLADGYTAAGKKQLFEALQDQLTPGGDQRPYAAVAQELGITEPKVRFTAYKLRKKYRELLREAIAETVTKIEEVDEELAHLRAIFGN